MEHSKLDTAALAFGTHAIDWETTDVNFSDAFKAGAEWQKERYKHMCQLALAASIRLETLGVATISAQIKTEHERLQD